MWNAATRVIDRIGFSEQRKKLLEKILSNFNIPAKGVAFVFEKEDYQNYPNPTWRKVALRLNIVIGGIEEISPQHLVKIMESKAYSQLIWLSDNDWVYVLLSQTENGTFQVEQVEVDIETRQKARELLLDAMEACLKSG